MMDALLGRLPAARSFYTQPLVRTGREVSIFVHRDGQLLLMKRARDGIWHIPAGVVEDGESYRETAPRELAEETGLIAGVGLADLRCTEEWTRRVTLKYVRGPGAAADAERRSSMDRVLIRLRPEQFIRIGTPVRGSVR